MELEHLHCKCALCEPVAKLENEKKKRRRLDVHLLSCPWRYERHPQAVKSMIAHHAVAKLKGTMAFVEGRDIAIKWEFFRRLIDMEFKCCAESVASK